MKANNLAFVFIFCVNCLNLLKDKDWKVFLFFCQDIIYMLWIIDFSFTILKNKQMCITWLYQEVILENHTENLCSSFWNRYSYLVFSTVHFIASLHSWISSVSEYILKAREELTNPQAMQHSYSLRKYPWPFIFCLNYCKLWSKWKECCSSYHSWL